MTYDYVTAGDVTLRLTKCRLCCCEEASAETRLLSAGTQLGACGSGAVHGGLVNKANNAFSVENRTCHGLNN